MIAHYAYVGSSLVALALLAGWMFVVSRRAVWMRVIGAAFALALAFVAWHNINAMLGYAVDQQPTGEVELVGMVDDRTNGFIYIWVKAGLDGPRAYRLPYSEGLAKSLLDAQEKSKEQGGAHIKVKFKGKAKGGKPGNTGAGRDKGLGKDESAPVTVRVVPLLPAKD